MRAIRVREFGAPEAMQLEHVPELTSATGEVLVRVRAAGINPSDTYARSGEAAAWMQLPPLPYTPGLDAAGEVIGVGGEVTHVQPGDRVYVARSISGTYAEQVLAKETQVNLLPQAISFVQGAAVGTPYGTAYRAI